MNDVALKAQTDGGAELSAHDVENKSKAICAHPVLTPVAAAFQEPMPQLAT